jgi:hypothetical protein
MPAGLHLSGQKAPRDLSDQELVQHYLVDLVQTMTSQHFAALQKHLLGIYMKPLSRTCRTAA